MLWYVFLFVSINTQEDQRPLSQIILMALLMYPSKMTILLVLARTSMVPAAACCWATTAPRRARHLERDALHNLGGALTCIPDTRLSQEGRATS